MITALISSVQFFLKIFMVACFCIPGTDRAIQIPDEFDLEESHVTVTSSLTNQTAVPNAYGPPEGEITLENKQHRAGTAVEKSEADSTLDFYS